MGGLIDVGEWVSERNGMEYENKTFIKKESLNSVSNTVGTLFYTADLGLSTKLFDELKGFSVESMWILPSHIFVLTSGASEADHNTSKLWVSTGGLLNLRTRLPE